MTDPLTQSLPQRIWLQVNPEGDREDRSQPVSEANWGELTWCYDSIGGQEVGYVREDLADGFTLLTLIADIRTVAGDREGRLMQPELVEHIRTLAQRVATGAALPSQPLIEELAECFDLGGSDADGNGPEWRAVHAVRSVRQLRQNYDAACDKNSRLKSRVSNIYGDVLTLTHERDTARQRIAELEPQNKLLSDDLDATEAERQRLRAENEAILKALDDYEVQTKALPGQHEIPERGCSTYNWRMACIRDLRSLIDAARAAGEEA